MKTTTAALLLSLVALSLVALPGPADAQEQADEARAAAEGVRSRFVGEWAYVPVTVVQGPYVTSFASSTTGLGAYTLDLDFDLPPAFDARTRDLDYVALLQRFDGQLAFLDRFAVHVQVQGEGVIPDTGESALSLALLGTWGGGGGLVAQLLSSDRLMLSLTADYRFLKRTLVSPAGAIEEAVTELRAGDLFTRQDVHRLEAGASAAFAFTDWLGLVAEAGWEGRWTEDTGLLRGGEDAYHFLPVAAALSANFWPQRLPLGLTGFWRERIPVGADNPFDHGRQVGGGLFYTGRPYLDVGVELFVEDEAQETGRLVQRASRVYVAPRIRGYF